jgi:hypothetical protein
MKRLACSILLTALCSGPALAQNIYTGHSLHDRTSGERCDAEFAGEGFRGCGVMELSSIDPWLGNNGNI